MNLVAGIVVDGLNCQLQGQYPACEPVQVPGTPASCSCAWKATEDGSSNWKLSPVGDLGQFQAP